MHRRAFVVASNLVETLLFRRVGPDHTSLTEWIDDVAQDQPDFRAARARFDEATAGNPAVNTEGHRMAFEYGRAGYELGVEVGLRLRRTSDP